MPGGLVCCDTSFLFSLYSNDVHTAKALRIVRSLGQAITLSRLNEFELGNALRYSEFRKLLSPGSAARHFADFHADVAAGRLILSVCNLADVLEEAKRLSMKYTLSGGHRSLDILHVAAALRFSASTFLTFDSLQQKLAVAEGLQSA